MSDDAELPDSTLASLTLSKSQIRLSLPLRLGLPAPDAETSQQYGRETMSNQEWALAYDHHLMVTEQLDREQGWEFDIMTVQGSGRGQVEAFDELTGPVVSAERLKLRRQARQREADVSSPMTVSFQLSRDELSRLRERLLSGLYQRELIYLGLDEYHRR